MTSAERVRLGVPVPEPTATAPRPPDAPTAPTPSGQARALPTTDPATGAPGPDVVCAPDAEVDAAITRADAARPLWRRTDPSQRADALRAATAT